MNLLSQTQIVTDSKQREKREGSTRNRKKDSVNTRGEVEMSMRKQGGGGRERKEREQSLELADYKEINN